QVVVDGIYRVTAADINVGNANPRFFHLMYRGVEEPIYLVNGGDPNLFDGSDYFEFFGRKNDGAIDSLLYKHPITGLPYPDGQPNRYHSLFTDTSAYFLTWDQTPGRRYTQFIDLNYSNYSPEPTFRHEVLSSYIQFYNQGSVGYDYVENSDYVPGEGYLGFIFGGPVNQLFNTPFAANTTNPGEIRFRVCGISRNPASNPHKLEVTIGNQSQVFTYPGIGMFEFSMPFSNSQLDELTPIRFTPQATGTDNNALAWVSVIYDRLFQFQEEKTISLTWQKPTNAYLLFQNLGLFGADSGIVYDVTNFRRIQANRVGTNLQAIVPATTGPIKLWVTAASEIKKPIITNHFLSNLSNPAGGAEFVIITHRDLQASAQAYATY
ncbi:MAG: hypothetical protein NZ108_10850, partial [Bacteroidia bacterium]|nr:hypothetical protein [Bacteroidia bacterium]